jgi:hypothetical protein
MRTRRDTRSSGEPGEDWSWCVIDEVAFLLNAPDHR